MPADPPEGATSLSPDQRTSIPKLAVAYTSRMPQRRPEREMVKSAPVLRVPYRARELAGVIGQLTERRASSDEAQAA